MRVSTWLSASVAIGLLAGASPAGAVIILDSTWEENGGAAGSEPDGFAAHEALAQEPQFAATVAVEDDDSSASGLWIGNDDEHGYVLTAGHAVGPGEAWEKAHPDELDAIDFDDVPESLQVVTDDGTVYPVAEVRRHPFFDHWANLAGTDMSVLVTEEPIEGLGDQPALYCGENEGGQTVTFLGYGTRGIGSAGADPAYAAAERTRTAGHTVIAVIDPVLNTLRAFFENEFGDTDKPDMRFGPGSAVDALQAGISHGDSGGPVFMETADGWAVVGLNTNGFTEKYGDANIFARLSTQRDFLTDQFADVTLVDGEGGDCSTSEHAGKGREDIYGYEEGKAEAEAIRAAR